MFLSCSDAVFGTVAIVCPFVSVMMYVYGSSRIALFFCTGSEPACVDDTTVLGKQDCG